MIITSAILAFLLVQQESLSVVGNSTPATEGREYSFSCGIVEGNLVVESLLIEATQSDGPTYESIGQMIIGTSQQHRSVEEFAGLISDDYSRVSNVVASCRNDTAQILLSGISKDGKSFPMHSISFGPDLEVSIFYRGDQVD